MRDFKALFEAVPDLYMVLSPRLELVAFSDAYLRATLIRREDVLGRHLFEVFPDNPDDPNATGTRNLRYSIDQVLKTGKANTMAVQKYDIRTEEGVFEERFWSVVNYPMFGPDGEIECIIHRAEDVTDYVRHESRQQETAQRMEKEIYLRAQEVQVANRELGEANMRLEAANRMKTEFLATMSHELRTPLNAIIGFSEVLKMELAGPLNEKQLDYVEDVFTSGQHLLSLINDILDLSKIEAGKMTLDLEPVELQPLFGNALTVIRERAATAGVALALELADDLPAQLVADRRKTTQIVYNLLVNAVKFSPGGRVVLRAARVPRAIAESWGSDAPAQLHHPLPASPFADFLEISVTDNGCGIASDDIARLFKPFSQIDTSLARSNEGTGLGLALVHNLARMHLGTAALESTPGEGSCFFVWLPWRTEAAI